MAISPEQKPQKPVNTYRQKGWPDVAANLGTLIISRNLLIPAGVIAVMLLVIWKLDSKDLRQLLDIIINRRWFAFGGWVMFGVTVLLSIKIVKWQGTIYRERIDELTSVKQAPVQADLNLKAEPRQLKDSQ